MSSEPEFDREGIYIDRELADEIAIEEELDANVVGPYLFPSPNRRRIAGWIYIAAGLIATFVIDGGWILGVGFGLIAAWHFLAAWDLNVDEDEALRVAGTVVPFAVGHSSASVRFVGWRSRPRWSVVTYSATEPPDERALVVVDAVNGDVVEPPYIEPITPV